MGSTRFPGKALADDTGMPMVVHVCEQASKAFWVERVVVATDSNEIFEAVKSYGYEAVMTSVDHANGTSRLAEAAAVLNLNPDQVIINIQGDEPEIDPEIIDAAEHALLFAGDYGVGSVVSPIQTDAEFNDPNVVKAALSEGFCAPSIPVHRAFYFSRAPIPYPRVTPNSLPMRHVGIYAYTVGAINKYLAWSPSQLELAESLEQLRWLEHGSDIMVAQCNSSHTGIDTPEQYRAFVERYQAAQSQ